VTLIAV